MVLPHIQYGLLLWGHSSKQIFDLQKRAVRTICKASYRAHTEPLFKQMKLLKIDDLYSLFMLKLKYKHLNEQLPHYFTDMLKAQSLQHEHNTRNRNCLFFLKPCHKQLEQGVRFKLPLILSAMPTTITDKLQTHSLDGLSKYCKNYYLSSYNSVCTKVNCYICNQG